MDFVWEVNHTAHKHSMVTWLVSWLGYWKTEQMKHHYDWYSIKVGLVNNYTKVIDSEIEIVWPHVILKDVIIMGERLIHKLV